MSLPQRIVRTVGELGAVWPQTGKEDLCTNVSHLRFFQRLQSVFVITAAARPHFPLTHRRPPGLLLPDRGASASRKLSALGGRECFVRPGSS